MKFFLIDGEYLLPFAELGKLGNLADEHRAFVQRGYDNGDFLFSGPQVPADGGMLVVRAQSREKLDELMAEEPFVREGRVRISRVIEFNPAKFQASLKEWFDE
jgi:uncharacterized protein YciI